MAASVMAGTCTMDYFSWRNGNKELVDAWYKRYAKKPKKTTEATHPEPWEVVSSGSHTSSQLDLATLSSGQVKTSSSETDLVTVPLEKVKTPSLNWDVASPPDIDHDPKFTTECFEVREAKGAGLGAFAVRDIKKGEVVMTETPLFLATEETIWRMYQGLTLEQRVSYLSLHAWSLSGVTWENRPQSVFFTNRFRTYSKAGETGIFIKSSRFNHQCHPYANCSYFFYNDKNRLIFTALKDIGEGEEITISYSNSPEVLPYNYGFACNCPGCLKTGGS